jgi:hypothetical protein
MAKGTRRRIPNIETEQASLADDASSQEGTRWPVETAVKASAVCGLHNMGCTGAFCCYRSA